MTLLIHKQSGEMQIEPPATMKKSKEIRHVLFIADSYPPRVSMGSMRMHRFVKHLPEHGWQPLVLTLPEEEIKSLHYCQELMDLAPVFRPPPWHTFVPKRRGRLSALIHELYIRTCIPDQWMSWIPAAVRKGVSIMRDYNVSLIFSSGPRFSSHLVGLALKKATLRPWIAEFRDPWAVGPAYEGRHCLRRIPWRLLERAVVKKSDQVIAVFPSLAEYFDRTYIKANKTILVTNGFEMKNGFRYSNQGPESHKLVFTYTGTFYPEDGLVPDIFLRSMGVAIGRSPALRQDALVRFVGFLPAETRSLARDLSIGDLIDETGFIENGRSISYQHSSNILLLFTGNPAKEYWSLPGKIFEYLGAQRPILALARPGSFVAHIVNRTGTGLIVPPDNVEAIATAILAIYDEWKESGTLRYKPNQEEVGQYSLPMLVQHLASLFDAVVRV